MSEPEMVPLRDREYCQDSLCVSRLGILNRKAMWWWEGQHRCTECVRREQLRLGIPLTPNPRR